MAQESAKQEENSLSVTLRMEYPHRITIPKNPKYTKKDLTYEKLIARQRLLTRLILNQAI